MSNYIASGGELYHYGVPGMKWGHRKAKSPSSSSDKRLEKLDKYTSKSSGSQSKRYQKKVGKLYNKYDKAANKDIKKAVKKDDYMSAMKISSGRTYAHLMMNSNARSALVADAARTSGFKAGKDFTYMMLKDEKIGGVSIYVNGVKSQYRYDPNGNLLDRASDSDRKKRK